MSIQVHNPRTPRAHVLCSTAEDLAKLREVATGIGYSAPDRYQALKGARGPQLFGWPVYVGECPCLPVASPNTGSLELAGERSEARGQPQQRLNIPRPLTDNGGPL